MSHAKSIKKRKASNLVKKTPNASLFALYIVRIGKGSCFVRNVSPWEESAETRTKEEGEPSKLRKTEVAQMKGSPVGNNFNRDTKRMCVYLVVLKQPEETCRGSILISGL